VIYKFSTAGTYGTGTAVINTHSERNKHTHTPKKAIGLDAIVGLRILSLAGFRVFYFL
jgi:L-ribulose-5-phosphate 3-epimerase UlaE